MPTVNYETTLGTWGGERVVAGALFVPTVNNKGSDQPKGTCTV